MLNSKLQPDQIAQVYKQQQAVAIPNFLQEDHAKAIFNELQSLNWNLEINDYKPGPRFRTPLASLKNPQAPFMNVLDEQPNEILRDRLFYMRLNVDQTDFHTTGLCELREFMNTPSFLEPMRRIVGMPSISHTWSEATCYKASCFLGAHRDDHHEHNRIAFVLNLTPQWKIDWGGLLMLGNPNMQPTIVPPMWNTLSLFTVPRDHFVSAVSPAATVGRYSITGWLRDGPSQTQ